jgi:CRP/FNR family transcriptional regulator, cyclic AMP receptor protein
MKERFEGAGRPNLVDAIRRQEIVDGDADLVEALIQHGQLLEFAKGDKIIVEGGEDSDLYLLVSGSVAILVKGTQVASRRAGQHLGEMSALEPAQKRSATVAAQDTVVALKVSAADFNAIATRFPNVRRPIARELARRLLQRNDLIPPPNEYPKLFIISSTESLPVAREIQASLERDVFSIIWEQGVFFAGGYPLEALETAVGESDFAVAVAEPDDIVESRGERHHTLRDNVLFELGLFMGKLTRYRTILVHPRQSGLKLPSDLQGLTVTSYTPGKPDELPARLGPACNEIRKIVQTLGVRTLSG